MMCKAKALIVLLLILCGHSAIAEVNIKANYSESANIFEIMDNVSQWWPGFTEVEYKKYWVKQFKLDNSDKKLFKRYSKLRNKYYNDPDQAEKNPLKNRNGFFSTIGSINADPVAEAFYSSSTLNSAFQKLKSIMTLEEIKFLKEFYKNFSSRYTYLIKESEKKFPKMVQSFNKDTSKRRITKFFDKVTSFYNVKIDITYTVLYVWWPPINRTNASPTGSYLIMRYNPKKHSTLSDRDIVMHEIVHTISAMQTLKKKQLFTEYFLKRCKVNGKLKRLKILEEPLAVILGQMLFIKKFEPTKFKINDNWYNDTWVNLFAKLSMPIVEVAFNNGKKINKDLIQRLSEVCNKAVKASPKL